MEITLLPINSILPHEKTRENSVLSLASDISRRRILLKPIIVDERTLTIIDGHHRYVALKMLGAHYVPVVLASYRYDIKSIGTWKLMLRGDPVEIAEYIEAHVSRGPSTLLITGRNTQIKVKINALDAYYALASFKPSGKGFSIVLRPPLNPRHVVKASYMENPLPPKTTRHITPLKNLRSPVKLSLLT